MMKRTKSTTLVALAAAGLLMTATAAGAVTVITALGPDESWTDTGQRAAGASVISDDVADRHGGEASLRQSTTEGSDKTNVTTSGEFGPVSELTALGFDWYRVGDSTAPGHLTPAFEVYVSDGEGNSWLLKWEGTYNGYPTTGSAAPVDEWLTEDLLEANFWRIPQLVDGIWVGFSGCNEAGDPYGCFVFDRRLSDDWLSGFEVVGLGVGAGSGWSGTFTAYVDHITINDTVFDFELTEPRVEVVLETKRDCFKGGWARSTSPEFSNQGHCVSSFQANAKAGRR
jgi:hypothetical protein